LLVIYGVRIVRAFDADGVLMTPDELDSLLYEPNALHKKLMKVTDEENIVLLRKIIKDYTITAGTKISYNFDKLLVILLRILRSCPSVNNCYE
jgi:hypothetical protein